MAFRLRSLVLLFATASAAFAQSVAPVIQTASSPKITLASAKQQSTTSHPASMLIPPRPAPVLTPQEISLLLTGAHASDKILLTLNNNHKTALAVTASVFTAFVRKLHSRHSTLFPSKAASSSLARCSQPLASEGRTLDTSS